MDNHNSKFSRFLSGKGFYVALAVCLVGTAAAAWVAIDSTQSSLVEQDSGISISQSSSSAVSRSSVPSSSEAPVNETVSDVPLSSSSAPAVSSEASSVPEQVPAEQPQTQSAPVQTTQEDVTVDTVFPTQEPLAFVMPADGEVFGSFSQGELVRNVTLGEWRTHDGIDIKAAKGSPVRAVADGVVSKVYDDPMWGTVVEITHAGGITSITSGLDPAVAVSQGDTVRVEDTIGVVGEILAEVSMDSHIHFGLKQDGKWVDPISTMGKAVE